MLPSITPNVNYVRYSSINFGYSVDMIILIVIITLLRLLDIILFLDERSFNDVSSA